MTGWRSSARSFKAKAALLLAVSGLAVSCQDQEEQTTAGGPDVRIESVTAALGQTSDLSTSYRLITSAELGEALDGEGSYTIFVPVNDAWSALESEELQSLESSEGRPQLVAVLRQHIAPGPVLPVDMDDALVRSDGSLILATMGAGPITLRRADQSIHIGEGIGGPRIIGAPIIAGNDVIYRIDQLIPPPE
jgi:uncharacterized surface protein with fasciclin (FAS1) repeats